MSALFRAEAVEAQRQSWLGGVRLVRPLSLTVLTVFAVSVAALLLGFLFAGEFTRKARLSGVLVAADGAGEAEGALQAQLLASPATVGLLRPDQPVWLRYEAYGPQAQSRRAGRILQVARTPEPAHAGADCVGAPAVQYRVSVALGEQVLAADGTPQPLAAGMRVEADVQLERRHLIDWLFAARNG